MKLKETIVAIGEYRHEREGILTCLGLGSCVGVALLDYDKKRSALAHIMLPNSKKFEGNNNNNKFADIAINKMIKEMKNYGCKTIVAKIAGGASMFPGRENFNIGKSNIAAVKSILNENNIKIIAEDIEGNFGRTLKIYPGDLSVKIKTKEYIKIL